MAIALTPAADRVQHLPVRVVGLAAQVEQLLVQRLRSGEFQVGDQLPSEHALSHRYGVSRATIRLALNALVRRGLIVSRHGVGSFVSEAARIANNLTEALDFSELIRRGGSVPGVIFDRVDVAVVDDHTGRALKLGPGEMVHKSAKRFTADGVAVIWAVTSLPLRLFDPLLTAQVVADPAITEPLFEFFDDRLQLPTKNQVTSVSAILGSAAAYPGAGLAASLAVLQLEEIGYSRDNQPLWHSLNWYPPGSMQFQLVRQRGGQ